VFDWTWSPLVLDLLFIAALMTPAMYLFAYILDILSEYWHHRHQ
jgi:hypothetical protein